MQQQVDRLDPAHRSVSFLKIKSTDAAARVRMIEQFLTEHFGNIAHKVSIENIFKGPYTSRSLTEVTVCEFPSKSVREQVLGQIREKNLHVKDSTTDSDGRRRYVLPGHGDFPMAQLLSILQSNERHIPLSLEWERHWHPELPPLDDALKAARGWWRQGAF